MASKYISTLALQKQIRLISFSIILLTCTLFFTSLWYAFTQLTHAQKKLSNNLALSKIESFISEYESKIIATASQSNFYNLLNLFTTSPHQTIEKYELKRQIARFSAPCKNKVFFEGSVVKNAQGIVMSQGHTQSKYHITVKLCYRDSTLSMNTGSPCIGWWKLYINKKKLADILSKRGLLSSIEDEQQLNLSKTIKFRNIHVIESKFPPTLFIKVPNQNHPYFILIIIFSIISLCILCGLIYFLNYKYSTFYINPIRSIYNHLLNQSNGHVMEKSYPSVEMNTLVKAVNKAIKFAKLEALNFLTHDLKQPLNRLNQIAYVLPRSERQKILDIHNQIYLTIGKVHNDEQCNIDLIKIIYDCVHGIYGNLFESRSIRINCKEEKYFSNGSYTDLLRVISNLIDNAIKASSNKPEIDIIISKDGHNLIQIQDKGCGIDSSKLPTIFNEETSYSSGTGNGLFIVKQILSKYHGKVKCNSIPNKGSTFTLMLPRSKTPFDYIHHIFINGTKKIIIIDKTNILIESFKIRYPNLEIIHITQASELNIIVNETLIVDHLFLVDNHFDEDLTGIDIIYRYNLLGNAYLYSDSSEMLKEGEKALRHCLPIYSMHHVNMPSIKDISSYQHVIVDDDSELLDDLTILDPMLLTLDNFLQLRMVLPLLNKEIPITLDHKIEGDPQTGLEILLSMKKRGYANLAIQSGTTLNLPPGIINLEKGTYLHATNT